MNITLYLGLIVLFSIILGVSIGIFSSSPSIDIACSNNPGCSWEITNCCSENAGANWDCVNLRDFKKPLCENIVACAQVISPKPEKKCACESGSCIVE